MTTEQAVLVVAMPGAIKRLIDSMIDARSAGNPTVASFVRAHLKLKGVDPDRFSEHSDDDPVVLAKVRKMMDEFSNF